MYQTTIANVNGTTATDTTGKVYYIAGNNNIVRGQQVWTDGNIIYGNTYGGGQSYIPMLGKAYLYYYDTVEYFTENLKFKNLTQTDAYTFTCSDKGEVFITAPNTIDACIGKNDDVYEVRETKKKVNGVKEYHYFLYENNEEIIEIADLFSDKIDLSEYIEQWYTYNLEHGQKTVGYDKNGDKLPYRIKKNETTVYKPILVHPDGTWNAFAQVNLSFYLEGTVEKELNHVEVVHREYDETWGTGDNQSYYIVSKEGDWTGSSSVYEGHKHFGPEAHLNNECTVERDVYTYFIPHNYVAGYTVGHNHIVEDITYKYYDIVSYGGIGFITGDAIISGTFSDMKNAEFYTLTYQDKKALGDKKIIMQEQSNVTWRLDNLDTTYEPKREKFKVKDIYTNEVPLDYEEIKRNGSEAGLLQTNRGIRLLDDVVINQAITGAPNFNFRLRKVKLNKAKKVLKDG